MKNRGENKAGQGKILNEMYGLFINAFFTSMAKKKVIDKKKMDRKKRENGTRE